MSAVAVGICIACMCVMKQQGSYAAVMGAGLVCFLLMGIAGSAVCYHASRSMVSDRHTGKTVGISYALGILLQYINNNLVDGDRIEIGLLSAGMVLFVIGMFALGGTKKGESASSVPANGADTPFYRLKLKHPNWALAALIASVALMTIIFSTLDNAVTLVHASGDFDIGQWPRLLLAFSGLAAGFIYDIRQRSFMPVVMYLVTLLSVASVVLIRFGGSFLVGLLVFYISAGFFVVFFMTSFMDISSQMKEPRLWAGMGRGINNLCAILVTVLSVSLLEQGSPALVMIVALVLFVLLTCVILLYYVPYLEALRHMNEMAIREDTINQMSEKNQTDKIEAFVAAHSFTERERDVFLQLLTSSESVNEMAKELAMSRANFYRHINRMNEKTNTGSRIELLQYFSNWKSI